MVGAACLLNFGEILPDQMECHLSDGNVIKPDLSLVSWERQRTRVRPIGLNKRPSLVGSPEFLVEVRSPSNSRTKDEAKRKRYFDNGAEIIWDMDNKEQMIYVYRANSQANPQTYKKNDEIDCEPLLPGWRRRVSDLFENEAPVEVIFSEVHAEGEKVGEVRGKQDALARLLQARFPDLPQRMLSTIQQTHDMAQLDSWFDQALMAPTLDELNFR